MPNIIYIATSLDGFIATEDDGLDWLMTVPNPDQSDYGFKDFMDDIDALVMGRRTFEQVMKFDVWAYDKPVFVLSKTMDKVPLKFADKAEVINDEIQSVAKQLNARGFKRLYIDGGVTIQSFLKHDLIDEMVITRVPILLGSGIPLFDNSHHILEFSHVQTEVLNKHLVKSHYKRIRTTNT